MWYKILIWECEGSQWVFNLTEGCCGILMGPSTIAMVIKTFEAVLMQFWVVLLFLRGLGQNGDLGDCSRLEGILRGQGVEITDHGLRDVIIFLVLHKDHKGLILTTYESSKPNTGLRTPRNPQQLREFLNLPVNQDPSEQLRNLLHHQEPSKLQFDLFRTLDYHLNNTGTHQNSTAPFGSIQNPLGTLTLPFEDYITYFKDDFF